MLDSNVIQYTQSVRTCKKDAQWVLSGSLTAKVGKEAAEITCVLLLRSGIPDFDTAKPEGHPPTYVWG